MLQGISPQRAKETTFQATAGNISNRTKEDLVFITEGVLNSEG